MKSYNRAVRISFNLPLTTHRNLIEPVSQCRHLMTVLASRFLGFLGKICESDKVIPKMLLNHVKRDVRSTTGSNLRNILLLTDKDDISELSKADGADIRYHPLETTEKWKSLVLSDLIDVRDGSLQIEVFSSEEVQDLIDIICTT